MSRADELRELALQARAQDTANGRSLWVQTAAPLEAAAREGRFEHTVTIKRTLLPGGKPGELVDQKTHEIYCEGFRAAALEDGFRCSEPNCNEINPTVAISWAPPKRVP